MVNNLMNEEIFKDKQIQEILKKTRVIWALSQASNLLGWDLEVNMPQEGITERSITASEIEVLKQKLMLEPELQKLLEKVEKREDELNDYEKGVIRVLKRENTLNPFASLVTDTRTPNIIKIMICTITTIIRSNRRRLNRAWIAA